MATSTIAFALLVGVALAQASRLQVNESPLDTMNRVNSYYIKTNPVKNTVCRLSLFLSVSVSVSLCLSVSVSVSVSVSLSVSLYLSLSLSLSLSSLSLSLSVVYIHARVCALQSLEIGEKRCKSDCFLTSACFCATFFIFRICRGI